MADVLEGRSCEGCAMCCFIPAIAELEKPANTWCRHSPTRLTCVIHGAHPNVCRDFHCGYLTLSSLGDEWKPSRSRIILVGEMDGRRITALVDPSRPDAWRKSPYHDQLRAWAEAAVPHQGQVVVRVGNRYWMVLPDRDVALGTVGQDEVIVTTTTRTRRGTQLGALKLPRSDPRAAGMV